MRSSEIGVRSSEWLLPAVILSEAKNLWSVVFRGDTHEILRFAQDDTGAIRYSRFDKLTIP